MRKIALLVAAALIAVAASAQDFRPKGYSGDVQLGYGFEHGAYPDNLFLSTTHGYQFNGFFFLGVGVAWDTFSNAGASNTNVIPVFADVKYYTLSSAHRCTPLIGMQAGYGFFTSGAVTGGLFLNPTIGVRIGVGQNGHGIDISGGYRYFKVNGGKMYNWTVALGFSF